MLRFNFWRNPENLEQKKAHLKRQLQIGRFFKRHLCRMCLLCFGITVILYRKFKLLNTFCITLCFQIFLYCANSCIGAPFINLEHCMSNKIKTIRFSVFLTSNLVMLFTKKGTLHVGLFTSNLVNCLNF